MSNVRKAVIPAAGRGTRQYPASSAVQKEMFTLVDRDGVTKPVIQMIAEEAIDSGIEEICIITQPGEEKRYRDFFKGLTGDLERSLRGKEWALKQSGSLADIGSRLHFAVQNSPEGFGHAIYQAKAFAAGEPFLLMLGDHVYLSETDRRCARQVIDVFESFDADAVTAVKLMTEAHLYLFGTIRGTPIDAVQGVYRAERIVEKPSIEVANQELVTPGLPAGNFLSHFGIHVFSAKIFDSLEHLIANNLREKNEIQLTAAQEHLRSQTDRYLVALVKGEHYDTGIPFGLAETQVALALNSVFRGEIEASIATIREKRDSR